jgi:hypothetical protein
MSKTLTSTSIDPIERFIKKDTKARAVEFLKLIWNRMKPNPLKRQLISILL